ncbi:MAG: hypothetical protein Q9201_002510 [Fulgogasparrea decipioides]
MYSSTLRATRALASTPPSTRNPNPASSILRLPSACHIRRAFPGIQHHAPSIRFASSASVVHNVAAADEHLAETLAPPPNEALLDASDIQTSAADPTVQHHYGFLKELGLDFGWGPTAFVEWALEHVHIGLGTPWWASIVLTMLAIRVVLFKAFVGSADMSARQTIIRPHLKGIRERMTAAKQSLDTPALMLAQRELRNLQAAAGIKFWKSALPLLQVPLGYGVFRLTRNMASLPVPGLEVGGILWFQDLTVSDPFFLLPIGTGVATFFVFKLGGETGGATSISPDLINLFKWGLPIISTVVMLFWPAMMQMTFFWTSTMALLQAYLFKKPWFRDYWGIHPLPSPTTSTPSSDSQYKSMVIPTSARTVPEEPETAKKGLFGDTITKLKNQGSKFLGKNQKPSGRRSAAEVAAAKRYEERRRKEAEQERQQRRSKRY